MIKTKITETAEKYDKDGNLIERITREESTEDDNKYHSGFECKIDGKDIFNAAKERIMTNPSFL